MAIATLCVVSPFSRFGIAALRGCPSHKGLDKRLGSAWPRTPPPTPPGIGIRVNSDPIAKAKTYWPSWSPLSKIAWQIIVSSQNGTPRLFMMTSGDLKHLTTSTVTTHHFSTCGRRINQNCAERLLTSIRIPTYLINWSPQLLHHQREKLTVTFLR